jgi:protein translocase SecG subunit
MGVHILSCLALIALVMFQTTKSEGLTGTIGGKMTSSFRGKPGIDEKMADITRYTAIAWMLLSLAVLVVRSSSGT